MGSIRFRPEVPFDNLPPIPPDRDSYETIDVLKLETKARAAISELKGFANIIPNQSILINAIILREAKDSSEIENIITTQDEIYKAVSANSRSVVDPAVKEVLRYREALWYGYDRVQQRGILTIPDIIEMQRLIVENDAGIRRTPGTALVNDKTGYVVYTPPQDERQIKDLLSNLAEYLNDREDTLIKCAVIHYQFESIHPFYDGNGRTGRIVNVLYFLLKRHLDIPILYLSSYIIEHKAEYYRLLRAVTSDNEWIEWISFFLKGIEETAKQTVGVIGRIKTQIDETIEFVRTRAPKIYSKELVEVLFENPYCKNEFVERAVGVERKAASRYLHELSEIGLLELRKIGRENLFINTGLMALLKEHTGT